MRIVNLSGHLTLFTDRGAVDVAGKPRKVTKTRGHFPTDDARSRCSTSPAARWAAPAEPGKEAAPATTGKQPSTSSTSSSPAASTGPNINTRSGAYAETLTAPADAV
jgi:hypothetical protein